MDAPIKANETEANFRPQVLEDDDLDAISGGTAVEYAVLLALIVVVHVTAIPRKS